MPHLIACTDGSYYASGVYEAAAWIANRTHISIKLLHVLDQKQEQPDDVDLSGALHLEASRELFAELAALDTARARLLEVKARALLETAVKYLRGKDARSVATVLKQGTLVDALAELEREPKAQMVVIGKRGDYAAYDHQHLGAKLERVIRACRRPILVANQTFRPIKRVLIAFDGAASSEKVIAYALDQSLLKGLDLHVLSVGAPRSPIDQALAKAADRLQNAGYNVTSVLRQDNAEGDIEQLITDYVRDEQMDMLMLGAYGHARQRHLIVGKTTTSLVRLCNIPLLIFK
ncbi:universal stress protein UspA [Iodidimonas nitroreducens]|uniref:Universal stress protein UspA n=1 Tax=Iodidimonas nitroreducens TaxID=1236968 RepID=A0A5A7N7J9_9PROT|nr:universal stress protein [Iodidimonas nitroreducens]GAK33192.1 universal stress protein [alpha proteobacterium Q-1]GER04302.1 universal stress protein UspA [Iodidimonas nitroreducens]